MVGTAENIVIYREGIMNVREQYFTIRGAGKDALKLSFAYDIPDEPIFDFDLPAHHRR